jgi:hypothetical protein
MEVIVSPAILARMVTIVKSNEHIEIVVDKNDGITITTMLVGGTACVHARVKPSPGILTFIKASDTPVKSVVNVKALLQRLAVMTKTCKNTKVYDVHMVPSDDMLSFNAIVNGVVISACTVKVVASVSLLPVPEHTADDDTGVRNDFGMTWPISLSIHQADLVTALGVPKGKEDLKVSLDGNQLVFSVDDMQGSSTFILRVTRGGNSNVAYTNTFTPTVVTLLNRVIKSMVSGSSSSTTTKSKKRKRGNDDDDDDDEAKVHQPAFILGLGNDLPLRLAYTCGSIEVKAFVGGKEGAGDASSEEEEDEEDEEEEGEEEEET